MKTQQQTLKTEKLSNGNMKKGLITLFVSAIILLSMINLSSAIIVFSTQELNNDTISTTYFYVLQYSTTNYDDIDGKPYESYILYSSSIDDWNKLNPNNKVANCNFSVYYSQFKSQLLQAGNLTAPNSILLYSAVFSGNFDNSKYFVRLNKGDAYYAYMTCQFVSPSARELDIPATISLVTPTWECQACQYYDWLQNQIKLAKAQKLADYTTKNVGYMGKFFTIFYEIAIMGFWVLMIFLLLLSVGLVFYGIYWAYKFIYKHTKIT